LPLAIRAQMPFGIVIAAAGFAKSPGHDVFRAVVADRGPSLLKEPRLTEDAIYDYIPHPRTEAKLEGIAAEPVKLADPFPTGNPAARFNAWFAVKVTKGVGTMWCAYAFAAIALISLPQAISTHNAVTMVSWVSQTFLQLVLLSVVLVGQNHLAAAADGRSEATYNDADAVLHEAVKIQEHLLAQDQILAHLRDKQPGSGS
jgi:hypothetical protein